MLLDASSTQGPPWDTIFHGAEILFLVVGGLLGWAKFKATVVANILKQAENVERLSKGQDEMKVELTRSHDKLSTDVHQVTDTVAKLDASLQVQATSHASFVKLWEVGNLRMQEDVDELKGDVRRHDRTINGHTVEQATIVQRLSHLEKGNSHAPGD